MERKMTAKKVTKCGREQTTTPLMIKDLVPGQFGLDDIATAELARQISLLEFELYSAVCAKEVRSYSRGDAPHACCCGGMHA